MKPVTIRKRFDAAPRSSIVFKDKSRAHQSFKAECDINTILKKYNKTGQLPDLIKKNPQYGDFSSPISYQEALDTVLLAQEQFQALPASVRERFFNDPRRFLAFVQDESSQDELVKMGLATARPVVEPPSPALTQKELVADPGASPKGSKADSK